jgi:hypothetical protein
VNLTDQAVSPGTSLSSQTGATLGLAGLFVVLSTPHFLLDSASFHQLPKASHRFLNAFAIS